MADPFSIVPRPRASRCGDRVSAPVDPDEGRSLARFLYRYGEEAMADALLAEVEAVEDEDEAAWAAAVARQVRAVRETHPQTATKPATKRRRP
jgi:hypothetical protein